MFKFQPPREQNANDDNDYPSLNLCRKQCSLMVQPAEVDRVWMNWTWSPPCVLDISETPPPLPVSPKAKRSPTNGLKPWSSILGRCPASTQHKIEFPEGRLCDNRWCFSFFPFPPFISLQGSLLSPLCLQDRQVIRLARTFCWVCQHVILFKWFRYRGNIVCKTQGHWQERGKTENCNERIGWAIRATQFQILWPMRKKHTFIWDLFSVLYGPVKYVFCLTTCPRRFLKER